MKKKQILIALLTLAISAGFIAVGTAYLNENPEHSQDAYVLKENEELKLETAKEVSLSIEEKIQTYDMKSLISILDSNIKTIESQEQREALIYEMTEHTWVYIRGELQVNQLLNHIRESKITPANMDQKISKIENEEIKFLYEKMKEGFIMVKLGYNESYIGENFLTDMVVDYDGVLNKYGAYIGEEFGDYLRFKRDTNENISRTTFTGLDYKTVLTNIEVSESFLLKYPESKYAKEVKERMTYNYQAYFGYYPYTEVFSTFNHKLSADALKQFEETAELDTRLGEKSREMIEVLATADNMMTPDVLKVIEEIGEVDKDSYFYYWYEVLELDNPFGEDLYDMTTEGITYVLDPDTGEKIGIMDMETGEIKPLDDVYTEDEPEEVINEPETEEEP